MLQLNFNHTNDLFISSQMIVPWLHTVLFHSVLNFGCRRNLVKDNKVYSSLI